MFTVHENFRYLVTVCLATLFSVTACAQEASQTSTVDAVVISGVRIIEGPAAAEEQVNENNHGEEHHGDQHGGEHSFNTNLIGVFTGVTSKSRRDASFTLGLEYNRRFTEHFGMGLIAEQVFADEQLNIYAVGFAYYFSPWKVYVAPGVEHSKAHGNEFLLRFGVEYAFEIGGFEIAPQIDVDFVDGDEVFVFGLTFGKGF